MARRTTKKATEAKANAKAKITPEQEVDAMVARMNVLTKEAGYTLLPPDNMDQAFILMQQIEMLAPARAQAGWDLYFKRFDADLSFQAVCEGSQIALIQHEVSRIITLAFV